MIRFSDFNVRNHGHRPPALEYCWPAELDRSPAPPLCAARAAAPLRDAPEAGCLARYPAVGSAAPDQYALLIIVRAQLARVSTNFGEAQGFWHF